MATRTLVLPVIGACPPSSNPAVLDFSGGRPKLLFDDTTPESRIWQFRMPTGYVGSGVLKIQYSMASATSNDVELGAKLMAVTPGDSQDMDADSYDTENTAGQAAAGTAGYMKEVSITLTNADSVAAGDYCAISLRRTCAASPKATGDAEVWNVSFEYGDA